MLYLSNESVFVVKTKIGWMTNTTDLALNLSTTSWTMFSVFLSSSGTMTPSLTSVLCAGVKLSSELFELNVNFAPTKNNKQIQYKTSSTILILILEFELSPNVSELCEQINIFLKPTALRDDIIFPPLQILADWREMRHCDTISSINLKHNYNHSTGQILSNRFISNKFHVRNIDLE